MTYQRGIPSRLAWACLVALAAVVLTVAMTVRVSAQEPCVLGAERAIDGDFAIMADTDFEHTQTHAVTAPRTATWPDLTGAVALTTGGQTLTDHIIGAAQLTVNDAGADVDTRIEGDGEANLLYIDAGNDRVGMGIAAPDGRLHVHTASAGAVVADGSLDDMVVENSANAGVSVLTPDASTAYLGLGSPSDAFAAGMQWNYNANLMQIGTAKATAVLGINTADGVEAIRINADGAVHIRDTANGKMVVGLTVNQGANDGEILAAKSSDVGHAMTDLAEADTYLTFQKANNTLGGALISGFTESAAAFVLYGNVTTDNTTKGATAGGPFYFVARKRSGAGIASMGADANIAVFQNNGTTVWHVDEDGDTWQAGGADFNAAVDLNNSDLQNAGHTDTNITSTGAAFAVPVTTTSYAQYTEMAAPGAGAANTARVYAVEDGGTLTDLVAVFQDGSTDVFAQETTDVNAPQFRYPSGTVVTTQLRKPHAGIVRIVTVYPDGTEQVIEEHQYRDPVRVAANVGADGPLPAGWYPAYASFWPVPPYRGLPSNW